MWPPHFSKEEAGEVIVEWCRQMQVNNVDADAFEKDAPDWLKKIVSHSSIPHHLLGDVFWSFNARSSAPSNIQKSAYDLSYLAFSLRKFTLTRVDGKNGKTESISVRDFDDIFQLRATFISDYDHYCSDASSEKNRLRISLEQRLPCNSVAESLRPHSTIEAQPPSAPLGAAAPAANAGVAERALEQTSSAGVAAAVGDNAVYTWLDLKGTVLSVALANEKEADLQKYQPRQ
jgi:hypothetical protein